MNPYLYVLAENVWAASIIPFTPNAALYAMKSFGGYNMPLAVAMTIIGAMLGQSFNWLLGRLLLQFKNKGALRVNDKAYRIAQDSFFKYYVFCILLFGWATGGNVIVVIAAFLGARYLLVMPLVALGYTGYLVFFLLS